MTDRRDAHTAVQPLAGRRILVTGGSTGIGRAIAVLLASEGARVFIGGHDPVTVADALARIREVGEGEGLALDLAEPNNVGAFVERGCAWLGGLDVAIADAAVGAGGLADLDQGALRRAIAIDFTAYLLFAHAALPRFGGRGDLIFIGSMSAHVLAAGSSVYAGIKYGIQGFARALRREQGPAGVRVTLIEPGLTGSNMIEASEADQRGAIAAEAMLRAEDIAVGVHYALTQPRRVVVQQLVIAPRGVGEE